MGALERHDHEILTVEEVEVPGGGVAIVRRHHTFYAHLKITVDAQVAANADVLLTVELVTWDSAELVTDMDRTVEISANDEPMCTVDLAGGLATVMITFEKAGTYTVRAAADRVAETAVQIEVSD